VSGSLPAEPRASPTPRQPDPSPGTTAVSTQVSDFPFTWYLSRVQLKVTERWAEQPRISEPPQRPFIFVEILRDGSIKPPRLEKSSGNAFYDQAALRAIIEASPFPPLPQEWNRPTLRILFGFELQPARG
jgi:protein TonB